MSRKHKILLWGLCIFLLSGCAEASTTSDTSSENVSDIKEEFKLREEDVTGTWIGEDGSGLTLFPDHAASYYFITYDEPRTGGTWSINDNTLELRIADIDADISAVISSVDFDHVLFTSEQPGWSDESYIKLSSNADALSKGEYDSLIAETLDIEIEKDERDLTGSWEEVGADKTSHYYAGYITDKNIVLYHCAKDGKVRSLYWYGTYEKNDSDEIEYSWTSNNVDEKTEDVFLCSHDETKDFVFDGETISFSATHSSEELHVNLSRSLADYSKDVIINDVEDEEVISFYGFDFYIPNGFGINDRKQKEDSVSLFSDQAFIMIHAMEPTVSLSSAQNYEALKAAFLDSWKNGFEEVYDVQTKDVVIAGLEGYMFTIDGVYDGIETILSNTLVYGAVQDKVIYIALRQSHEATDHLQDYEAIINRTVKEGVAQVLKDKDVVVMVIYKANLSVDYNANRYSPRCNFVVRAINGRDKDIRGIQGVLTIKDMFGKEIKSVNCDLTGETIASGDFVNFVRGMDINQFIDADVKIYTEDFEDLQFEYRISMIVYEDGTTETYQ